MLFQSLLIRILPKARNGCIGLFKLWNNGEIIHPCQHHKTENAKRCLLPWAENDRPPQDLVTYFLNSPQKEEALIQVIGDEMVVVDEYDGEITEEEEEESDDEEGSDID